MAVVTAHNDDGFTLVEVLCVLVILGLATGLVVLNLPTRAPAIETQLKQVSATLNIAARDSQIDGQVRGVDITPDGYELFNYTADWTGQGQQEWSDMRRVKLDVDGIDIDFEAREEADVITPLIVFDPTEGVTPFVLELQSRDGEFILASDDRGQIILQAAP